MYNCIEHINIFYIDFRNHAVTVDQKVLLTLRFYALGSTLMAVGDFTGVDKSTASRIVRQVTLAIAGLREIYIKFPNSAKEIREKQLDFFKIAKFPRVIGALDCTHVKILSPGSL